MSPLRLGPVFRVLLLLSPVGALACGGGSTNGKNPDGGDAETCTSTPTFLHYSPAVSGCAQVDLTIPCGLKVPASGAALPKAECTKLCAPFAAEAGAGVGQCYGNQGCYPGEPAWLLTCELSICQTGRRPAGLRPSRAGRGGRDLGAYLAEAARFEEASVAAFRVLGRELSAHRAPAGLVRGADRASLDERRHTRTMTRLALRDGVRPPRARVERRRVRRLEEIALENAVEGCVRETFGALVACRQAERALDPEVARAMRAIAADETRHAELAWSVHRWARRKLSAEARAKVDDGMKRAFARLEADAGADDATLCERAGLPSRAEARALVRGLRAALLAA